MLKLLTYDSLLAQASEHILNLPETKQKELKENLSHGKALLKSGGQMKAYLHHYGRMHRDKLLRALKQIPTDFLKSSFSVTDWGCGYQWNSYRTIAQSCVNNLQLRKNLLILRCNSADCVSLLEARQGRRRKWRNLAACNHSKKC